jgi:hypothetical protein
LTTKFKLKKVQLYNRFPESDGNSNMEWTTIQINEFDLLAEILKRVWVGRLDCRHVIKLR